MANLEPKLQPQGTALRSLFLWIIAVRLARRTFLITTTEIFLASTARAQDAETADKIHSCGPILTMTDEAPRADAVAVKGGCILAMGALADVMKLKTDKTRMVDLKGTTPSLESLSA